MARICLIGWYQNLRGADLRLMRPASSLPVNPSYLCGACCLRDCVRLSGRVTQTVKTHLAVR